MCGRFVQVSPPTRLLEHFDCDEAVAAAGEPDWNVTPRREVLVVLQRSDGRRVLDRRRWGLIPSWAREAAIGDRLINARGETAADKPSFRSAYARRRCIVPADGFYEWRSVPGRRTKQPVFIHAPSGDPLALAGLWESWQDPTAPEDAPPVRTCTIITTDANACLAPVHDRMPVILPATAWSVWLDPASDPTGLASLLVPAPEDAVEFHDVGTAVNTPRHNDPSLVEPAPPETLF